MSKTFITADLHFSHINLCGPSMSRWKDGYRTFHYLEEMNRTLLDNINNMIGEEDTLWFLGDWSFGGHQNVETFRNLINCKTIHFIVGNHDKHISKYTHLFSSVQDRFEGEIEGHKVYMQHHPAQDGKWPGKSKGVTFLFGHCHAKPPESMTGGKFLDCGIDRAFQIFGEYRPFLFEEAIEIASKR